MRFFSFCLILLANSIAYGQEELPQSPRAVKAREAYNKAISKAASAYQKDLEYALRISTQDGDVKEIIRINRVLLKLRNQVVEANGPIAKSRQALEKSTWTFVRGQEKERLDFGEDYKMTRASKIGAWTMLNPQSAAIFVGPEIFVLKFNESFTRYSVHSAYSEVNTKFSGGVRVTN